ncbi:probable inactive poly [ADP-ribose] polymerase SRO3 [Salvia miltiorrhiza]|uniref:probable inactive poly [ADP-ribose] polymerase SRO3 n=1 Tax=Salvia miltiorrhiza TaxID=226208 RepID=UPI0025ACD850|nr:probable inactive poly [ADP-ribose] polymerase SRO3 [Salvia miltiorrhiza]
MNSLNSTSIMTKRCAEVKSSAKALGHRSSAATRCEPLIQNYSNFKRSSCPKRLMFYENGSWVDYSEEVADLLKLGFAEGRPMVEAQVLGYNCFFDLYRMLEIDLESGNQRSIAWIDADGKCFFPKTFVDSCENDREVELVDGDKSCAKIEIDIKIVENSGNHEGVGLKEDVNFGKRGRSENVEKGKVEESFCGTAAKRLKMVESESQSSRWPKARNLAAGEKRYAIVKNLFLSGLENVEPGARITSIHQCVRMGPLDKARSEIFAKQVEIKKRARGESNVVFAWYGASSQGVESILMHGFGIPSKLSRSAGHGIGIHLSPIRSPQNSAMLAEVDENGEKHVILCRVILGKCEKVEAGSLQSYPSSVEYDTGVDDLNNPRWYTVWHGNMNTHILPECVVSYRPVNINGSVNSVPKNWVPHPSTFIAKLFSKLRGSLPLPQFCELQTSWESCKEGKLGKDAFMKKLRLLVGDDVLRSAIQEIRG